jgi:hypothetical protein
MKAKLLTLGAFSFALGTGFAYAQDTVVVPDTVTTYVQGQSVDEGTTVEGDVAVGTALPDTVVVKKVPDNEDYEYAVVNKKRVIIEPKTRKVVKIIE